MKISCPSCSAKYSIADEKVQDRLAKIRCRKCSATIVIDGKVSPANVYTTSGDADTGHDHAADAVSGGEYSVDFGEGDQRNLPLGELIAAYNAGQVTGETYVWADGFPDWKMIREVPEIIDALNAGGGAPAPAPAAMPVARAAVRTTGRAGAADLFGRIESAGSEEEDVATSAPDGGAGAAPSPFGGGGGGGGFGSAGSTGARNESSVLFSLSALTAGASKPAATAASKPAAAAASGEKEDSGLIDLKALTAAATKSDTAAAGMGGPLGAPLASPLAAPPLGVAAPLGLGSPLGHSPGMAISADLSMPQQKSKTGIFIMVGFVLFALIIAGAFVLRPAEAPVTAAPETAPTIATTPTATPTATQEELAAKPPSTGVAAEGDAPDAGGKATAKAGYVKRGGGGAAAPKKGGGAAAPGGAAPAPDAPPPPKKKNPCGCASGDLQCNMRCAAGG